MMTYSSTMVANNILTRAFAEKIYISPMKLQKILYFVASEYQKYVKRPLLEEPFCTWAFGPVAYSVYDEFRSFSKESIKRYARDAHGNAFIIDETQDPYLKIVLDNVWHKTKNKRAIDLSEITHIEGSAWDKAFQNDSPLLDSDDIASDTTYREKLGLEG